MDADVLSLLRIPSLFALTPYRGKSAGFQRESWHKDSGKCLEVAADLTQVKLDVASATFVGQGDQFTLIDGKQEQWGTATVTIQLAQE